jgi:thiol-disulfide isomerase/thioredoxin
MTCSRRQFLALAAGAAAAAALPATAIAQSADWTTAPFADGSNRAVNLAAFLGRPIVLNFWATWCVPCRSEMPSLDALQAGMGDQVRVLPVSVDEGGMPVIEEFYRQYNLTALGRYHDHVGALRTAFGVTAYPTSYLINSRGVIVGAYARAFDWNSTVARAAIAALR